MTSNYENKCLVWKSTLVEVYRIEHQHSLGYVLSYVVAVQDSTCILNGIEIWALRRSIHHPHVICIKKCLDRLDFMWSTVALLENNVSRTTIKFGCK